jgi:hypothetical protein
MGSDLAFAPNIKPAYLDKFNLTNLLTDLIEIVILTSLKQEAGKVIL